MIRRQVQIAPETWEALRRRAFAERKSIAATLRAALARGLDERPARRQKPRYRFGFVGMARGKAGDVAVRHDDYLTAGSRW